MKATPSFAVAALLLSLVNAADAFVVVPKFSFGKGQYAEIKQSPMGMTSSSPSEDATGGRVMDNRTSSSSSNSSSSTSRGITGRAMSLSPLQMQPDGFGEWMMPSNSGKDYNEFANPYMYHDRAYRYHVANDGGYYGQMHDLERRADAMDRFKYSPLGNRRYLPSYTREEFSSPGFHLSQNEELMWKYQDERNFIENPRGTNLRGYSGWRW